MTSLQSDEIVMGMTHRIGITTVRGATCQDRKRLGEERVALEAVTDDCPSSECPDQMLESNPHAHVGTQVCIQR